jgi:hypothetical protein
MCKKKLAAVAAMLLVGAGAPLLFAACAAGPGEEPETDTAPEPGTDTTPEGVAQEELIHRGTRRFCGGFAGIPCPPGLICRDDPRDDCDPNNGGADCGGICVPRGIACFGRGRRYVARDPAVCAATTFLCTPPLVPFFDECGCGCEPPPPSAGVPCGQNTCRSWEFCCNESCGICAPRGGVCIQIEC